jgi:capsular exopolysaccharide synthesis family protein
MVTSAVPGEGKSTVAAGLARAAALAGQRVILVEADLRRPTFHEQFALGDDPRGLTTALVGGAAVRGLLRPALSGMRNLSVLPAGPLPPNSAELLRSAEMASVLRDLAEEADIVILDAPPLLPVADAQVLLDHPQVDACIVVARAFRSTRDEVRRSRAVLERHRLTSVGLVVNGVRQRDTSYAHYYSADGEPASKVTTPSS